MEVYLKVKITQILYLQAIDKWNYHDGLSHAETRVQYNFLWIDLSEYFQPIIDFIPLTPTDPSHEN